jgi:hypothetical protein
MSYYPQNQKRWALVPKQPYISNSSLGYAFVCILNLTKLIYSILFFVFFKAGQPTFLPPQLYHPTPYDV